VPQIYTQSLIESWESPILSNAYKKWLVLDLDGDPIDITSGFNLLCWLQFSSQYPAYSVQELTTLGTWTKGDGFIEVVTDANDWGPIPYFSGTYSLFVGETGNMTSNRSLVAYGSWSRPEVFADFAAGI